MHETGSQPVTSAKALEQRQYRVCELLLLVFLQGNTVQRPKHMHILNVQADSIELGMCAGGQPSGGERADVSELGGRVCRYGYFFRVLRGCRDKVSTIAGRGRPWLTGFGCPGAVPLAAFALALAIYLAGTPLYQRVPPGGSALTRIAQVPCKCNP